MEDAADFRRPLSMDEVTMLLGQRDVAIYQLAKQVSTLKAQVAQRDAELQKLRETPPRRRI